MSGKSLAIVLGLASLFAGLPQSFGPARAAEAPASSEKNSASSDVLQFTDGSLLHGRLHSMVAGQGVGWENPEAKAPIQFRPANIAWIRFEKPVPVTRQAKPNCRLRFNNGDEVFGNLTGIEDGKLAVDTWFGGGLTTPREALQSITFLSKGFSVLYEGPSSAEGWVQGKAARAWEYRDGAFVANGAGTLGRDFQLSGSSSFSFDLSWNGHFSLILALYTSVLDRFDYSSSSYMFYLSPGYITLQRVQGGAGAINLGQAQIADMGRKNRLHMEIRASKEENSLMLLVDDRLVQRWKDTSGFVGQGSGAVFFAQLDGPSIKVSNLKVAQWEGDTGIESLTNAPTKDDLIYLVNRDRVNGRLESLRNDSLTVAAGQTSLEIPLSRVSQINLGSSVTNAVRPGPWQMRAYFAGGGTLAFELAEWKPGRVVGKSSNFGPIEFDSQFIRQLQFNLSRTKLTVGEVEVLDEEPWEIE